MPDRSAELLLWLLGVPAAILAAVYLLGPIGVLLIGPVRRNPTSIPFDPRQTPAPPQVQQILDRSIDALRPEGFEPVSHVVLPDMLPDTKMISVMLVRRPDEVQALINVSVGTVGSQAKIQDRCVEFVTAFADGTEHHTLWNLVAPPIPRLPSKSILQVDSDDAAFLWRVHRAAVEANRTAKTRPLPADVASPQHVSRETTKSWTELADVGYARLDDKRNEFRLTIKGAYVLTWGMLWPVSRLRRALRRRRNARLFAQLGLTDDAHALT